MRDYFFAKIEGQDANLPEFKINNRQEYYDQLFVEKPHADGLSIRVNNSFELDLREF